MRRLHPKNEAGFSLLETLCTLAIISILGLSVTQICGCYFNHQRGLLIKKSLMQAIHNAQLLAVLKQQPISFCASKNPPFCRGDWHQGQTTKIANQNSSYLQHSAPLPKGWHLAWHSSFYHNHALVFNTLGLTQGQQGHFELTGPFQQKFNITVAHYGQAH